MDRPFDRRPIGRHLQELCPPVREPHPETREFVEWVRSLPIVRHVILFAPWTLRLRQDAFYFRPRRYFTYVVWVGMDVTQSFEVWYTGQRGGPAMAEWLQAAWAQRPMVPDVPLTDRAGPRVCPDRRVYAQPDAVAALIATIQSVPLPRPPSPTPVPLQWCAEPARQWLLQRHQPDARGQRFIVSASQQLKDQFGPNGMNMYNQLVRSGLLVNLRPPRQPPGIFLLHDVPVRLRQRRT